MSPLFISDPHYAHRWILRFQAHLPYCLSAALQIHMCWRTHSNTRPCQNPPPLPKPGSRFYSAVVCAASRWAPPPRVTKKKHTCRHLPPPPAAILTAGTAAARHTSPAVSPHRLCIIRPSSIDTAPPAAAAASRTPGRCCHRAEDTLQIPPAAAA